MSGLASRRSGPPVHDGPDQFTPEAERQLNELDDWITKAASADTAQRFVSAVLDHVDGILIFPPAGRARDDVRAGMRVTTYKKRAIAAYEIDQTSAELVVNTLGVFHGGQNWEAAYGEEKVDPQEG